MRHRSGVGVGAERVHASATAAPPTSAAEGYADLGLDGQPGEIYVILIDTGA